MSCKSSITTYRELISPKINNRTRGSLAITGIFSIIIMLFYFRDFRYSVWSVLSVITSSLLNLKPLTNFNFPSSKHCPNANSGISINFAASLEFTNSIIDLRSLLLLIRFYSCKSSKRMHYSPKFVVTYLHIGEKTLTLNSKFSPNRRELIFKVISIFNGSNPDHWLVHILRDKYQGCTANQCK